MIKRFIVLDAFRGIAALLVFLYHMPDRSWLTKNEFIIHCGVFVDLFFVLSGFVIYHNYRHKIVKISEGITFIIKRFKRLYPLHLYTLLVVLGFECFKLISHNYLPYNQDAFTSNSWDGFFIQLFMLNATPVFTTFNWNFQNWSVSAEFISYLVFALTTLSLTKYRKAAIIFAVLVIIFGFQFYDYNYDTFNLLTDYNFSFIRALIGFHFGILVYELKQYLLLLGVKVNRTISSVLEVVNVGLVVYIITYIYDYIDYFFIINLTFALLIGIFSIEGGFISKLFKANIFQNLGLWSYSIYLNHIIFIVVYKVVIRNFDLGQFIILPEICLVLCVCMYSKFTYKYIERRFYKAASNTKL